MAGDGKLVSKGMLALRRSNNAPLCIKEGGDSFWFKKLTIEMEEAISEIVRANQDDSLKAPEKPAEDADDAAWKAFGEAFLDFKTRSDRAFRKLTAEIMRYVLVDENGNPYFDDDDDVFSMLNNVYAKRFYDAYTKFRNGTEVTASEAEKKFPV
jgi:hypothetical protein